MQQKQLTVQIQDETACSLQSDLNLHRFGSSGYWVNANFVLYCTKGDSVVMSRFVWADTFENIMSKGKYMDR